MEKFAPRWGTLLGKNTFILWGGERTEKERGVAAWFFSFKNKGRSGRSSNLLVWQNGKKAFLTLADAHMPSQGPPVLLRPLP